MRVTKILLSPKNGSDVGQESIYTHQLNGSKTGIEVKLWSNKEIDHFDDIMLSEAFHSMSVGLGVKLRSAEGGGKS